MTTKRAWPEVARGMSQKALAERMGRPLQASNEIVLGKKQITAEAALQLEARIVALLRETAFRAERGSF